MMELLPKLNLQNTIPSFYDTESVTVLELTSKLYGAMNELIKDYNNFVEETNNKITEFTEGTNENLETFETAMRQEFQDFIDVVNLKIEGMLNEVLSTKY